MAIVLNQVTDYLDRRGWRYHAEPERSHIITGVAAENVERFLIGIQLKDEGKVVSLVAPQLLMVKDHGYKREVLRCLLAIAWEVKLLRWEYDPRNGEIRASVCLLLEDTSLTERQFNRALGALIQMVDEVSMPRLKEVLATGIDPGRQGLQASLLEMLQQLQELIPSEDRAALQAELNRRMADETEYQG